LLLSQRQLVTEPWTKQTDLGCESTYVLLLFMITAAILKAGTDSNAMGKLEGWVVLGRWFHIVMVYFPRNHPCSWCSPACRQNNFDLCLLYKLIAHLLILSLVLQPTSFVFSCELGLFLLKVGITLFAAYRHLSIAESLCESRCL